MSLRNSFASLLGSAALLVVLCGSQAQADEVQRNSGPLGLGVIVGEPTGFSAEYKLPGSSIISPSHAFDGAFAYSFARMGDWQIHSDYLFDGIRLFQSEPAGLTEYVGGGGRVKFESSLRVGARIPVGVNYGVPDHQQCQFFGEVAPIVDVAPSLEMSINISVGARYFF